MRRRLHRCAALSLALTAVAACTSASPNGDGGGPDSGDIPLDAGADADVDIDVDAGAAADGSDAAEAEDARDASDAEDASDAADALDDADALDAADDGATDASDAGVPWVITSCSIQEAAGLPRSSWVTSDGKWYMALGMGCAPPAGGPWSAPYPSPISTLTPDALAVLIAAAQAVDSSTAGYTTTVGPPYHNTTRVGTYRSAGAPKHPETLVDSWRDGRFIGTRTVISANEPETAKVRAYRCFVIDGP